MEISWLELKEGEIFPFFKKRWEQQKGKDFSGFDSVDEINGYLLSIYYNGLTEQEKEILKTKPVNVRLVETVKGFVLPMLRFGNSKMIFELEYDPNIYPDARSLQLSSHNNLIGIAAMDSRDNRIKVVRTLNMPLKMVQTCSDEWARALLNPSYSVEYKEWLTELRSKSTIYQLWDRGIPAGKLGEVYNPDEIHYR